jgi:hypothetical protein
MSTHLAVNDRRSNRVYAAAICLTVALACPAMDASAQQQRPARHAPEVTAAHGSIAELERAFWICDYMGTNYVVDPDSAARCVVVTDALKMSKFNGDFDALVAWWKVHKPAEHTAIELAGRTVGNR